MASMRTRRGRVAIAIVSSLVLTAVWMSFEGTIGILPAVMVPLWIPVFMEERKHPVSRRAALLMMGSVLVGTILLAALGWIYLTR